MKETKEAKPSATPNTNPDAFAAMLAAVQALYEAEILRLADVYRPRILAGEFSGDTPAFPTGREEVAQDEKRFLTLERDLLKHPWLATVRGRLLVEASSGWLAVEETVRDGLGGATYEQGDRAAESMAHDILAVAAERGWVKPLRSMRQREWYGGVRAA